MKRRSCFTVQGKQFYSIGIQAHNSSSYMPETMEDTWNAANMLRVNTVAVPVPWGVFEPEEGVWNARFVTSLIDQAREHNLHLVLLWFGTWKNGTMEYAPSWVKADPVRFPRVQLKDGTKTLNLSPHHRANLEADQKAFCKMLQVLKAYDEETQTVLAVQIENEAGFLSATRRDFSPMGEAAFRAEVPQELLDWCVRYPESLLAKRNREAGCKQRGNWLEVFGGYGAEAMTAYAIARYIDEIAKAGRAVYDTFFYTNAWLNAGRGIAGIDWPAGTCGFGNLDIYLAICEHLDLIAPDNYKPEVTEYLEVLQAYHRPELGNPLYIPESARTIFNSGMMFEAVGAGAIGFHVFGGESLLNDRQDGLTDEGESMMHSFAMLSAIKPMLEKHMGTGRIHAICRRGAEPNMLIEGLEGGWRAFVSFTGTVDQYLRMDYRHKEACAEETLGNSTGEPCRGLLIQDSENGFYLVGNKFRLFLLPPLHEDGSINAMEASSVTFPTNPEYLSVCEGTFDQDGRYVIERYRTGDEARHGTFATWDVGVLRIEMQQIK